MSLILLLRPIGAHPRLRGEHSVLNAHPLTDCGSSPLTRGARVVLGVRARVRGLIPAYAGSTHALLNSAPRAGLIPAYAGSTATRPPFASRSGAHPRLRGEHAPQWSRILLRKGSSPLTRGTLRRETIRLKNMGLIPAYAGNTDRPGYGRKGHWAHPRLRGEHTC